jgi:branched-subunit amino acid transport protein
MNTWVVIVAVGLGSYLFRLSMIILTGRITMPPYLERASGLVVPAAFAAVVAAVIAVLRTGSSQAAILVGMPVLWIATALLPS